MALDQLALDVVGKALWDPRPTTSDLQACQLANALGYPDAWRVVRAEDQTTGKFFDRIYSGSPDTPGCDCWMNHANAMDAAARWETTDQTQHAFKGGDMLRNRSQYRKGDKVEVGGNRLRTNCIAVQSPTLTQHGAHLRMHFVRLCMVMLGGTQG
jgi:hypothetical protein